jgi:ABC-type Fe3+-hydroxamate transport system substrate-binding protein
MKLKFGMLMLAGALALSACGEEECTVEVAQKKATEMMAKVQEIATTAPEKLAALQPKIAEIQTQAAAAGDDPAAACKAIDDLMAELAK